jgi:hypothetical protein
VQAFVTIGAPSAVAAHDFTELRRRRPSKQPLASRGARKLG